ncbi:MAG: hypothetical protein WD492_06995 [Alkalispirochaeta sp.]
MSDNQDNWAKSNPKAPPGRSGYRPPKQRWPMKKKLWFYIGIIFALMIIFSFIGQGESDSRPLSRSERVDNQFSPIDGSNRKLVQWTKDQLHDIDSFQHKETRIRDDGSSSTVGIQMEFTATNMLGGRVKNFAYAEVNINTGVISGMRIAD